jgi:hypothetical protein
MNNPIITASGAIPAFSCVKVSTTANTVVVCTTSTDTVFGVTFAGNTANGAEVVFQTSDTQLDIVTLRAGGTIAAGDELVPAAAGAVVTAAVGQFIAMTAATSGQTLTAYKKKVGSIPSGLYGSLRANTFIKDCVAGTDSVDVITIGDSNVGYNGCGTSTGFREALAYRGALQYATCLTPMAENVAGNGNVRQGGTFTNMCEFTWRGNTAAASQTGNSTIQSLNAAVTAADASAIALSTAVGTFANYKPSAFIYDAAFVNAGSPTNTFTSGGNGIRIVPAASTAFAAGDGSGGVPLQYRVVYGTFASGSGQFKLSVARAINTIVARSASPILTNTGTNGISATTATLNFNTPEVSNVAVAFACNIDGYANGTTSDYVVGPAAFFWHSLMYQTGKGYSVTNLTYYGGRTTAQLATDMASNPTLIRATLRELRTRQIVAGGSGRVLVLNQSGINDGSTGASYTTNLDAIVSAFRTEWTALGYPSADLAFVITSTHPTPNSLGGEAWFTNRPIFNANAQAWATANINDGRNITYCDFGAYRTAAQMVAAYQYSFYVESGTLTPYSVHLRTSAGSASTTWSDSGVTSVPNPTPGGSGGWSMQTMSSENAYMAFGNYMVEQLLK